MLGTTTGGENPGPGPPENTSAQYLVGDLKVFQVTEGSTGSFFRPFGADLSPREGEKSGTWIRWVVEAADCFMARWRKGEAERSWIHHAAANAKSGDKGRVEGSRTTVTVVIQL